MLGDRLLTDDMGTYQIAHDDLRFGARVGGAICDRRSCCRVFCSRVLLDASGRCCPSHASCVRDTASTAAATATG